MHFVSEAIENYCIEHSQIPSEHCRAIAEYTRANVPMSMMLIGEMEGSCLGFLVRLIGAKRVLEVGTYTGYSALVMAEALPADGEVVTLDVNPETTEVAKGFWAKSPSGKKIKSILGPAADSMKSLTGPFDLVFIDADKPGYVTYLENALKLLSPKGLIIADNTLFGGHVLEKEPKEASARGILSFNEYVRGHAGIEATLLPVRDGMTLIRRKGA